MEGDTNSCSENSVTGDVESVTIMPPSPPPKPKRECQSVSEEKCSPATEDFILKDDQMLPVTANKDVSGLIVPKTMFDHEKDDSGDSEEVIPPARMIILALEQRRASESSGNNAALEVKWTDRPPPSLKKSYSSVSGRKIPPQVPKKTFRGEQLRRLCGQSDPLLPIRKSSPIQSSSPSNSNSSSVLSDGCLSAKIADESSHFAAEDSTSTKRTERHLRLNRKSLSSCEPLSRANEELSHRFVQMVPQTATCEMGHVRTKSRTFPNVSSSDSLVTSPSLINTSSASSLVTSPSLISMSSSSLVASSSLISMSSASSLVKSPSLISMSSASSLVNSPSLMSMSSSSSLAEAQNGVVDTREPELKVKAVMSFTAEDVEFYCKPELQSLPSPVSCEAKPTAHGKFRKRLGQKGRWQSVGAPGFCMTDFCLPKDRPRVLPKPERQSKHEKFIEQSRLSILSNESSSLSSDSPHVEGTDVQVGNNEICLVFDALNCSQSGINNNLPAVLSPPPIQEADRSNDAEENRRLTKIAEVTSDLGFSCDNSTNRESKLVGGHVNGLVMQNALRNFIISETSTCERSCLDKTTGSEQFSVDAQISEQKSSDIHSSEHSVINNGDGTHVNDLNSGTQSLELVNTNGTSFESSKSSVASLPAKSVASAPCLGSVSCAKTVLESFTELSNCIIRSRPRDQEKMVQQFRCSFYDDAALPTVMSGSSLFDEIIKIIDQQSSPPDSEVSTSGSAYSVSSTCDVSSVTTRSDSSEICSRADILSAAMDSIKLEMENISANFIGIEKSSEQNLLTNGGKNPATVIHLPHDSGRRKSRTSLRSKTMTMKKGMQREMILSDEEEDDGCNVEYEESGSETEDSESECNGVSPADQQKPLDRAKLLKTRSAFHVATELLVTERNYVRKLHLVDQVFQKDLIAKNRDQQLFSRDVIPQIFSNIKSIYLFHHDFLLPQLEKRMIDWEVDPRIGDVMKKFAPFLKLYTEYVRNYETAITTIRFWLERSTKFQKTIEELQKLPECGHLNLQHHMLEPVQRVPRYRLLLNDYLRHLAPDSPDIKDTTEALELVSQAAEHSNNIMRKIDKFHRLVEINECVGGTADLVSPSREFIKEGKITKVSARDGGHMDRYLFLFNDLFLVCQSVSIKIGLKQQYRVKSRMMFDGTEVVVEGHSLETPNIFCVKGRQKSIKLHAGSVEEKNEWMKVFRSVISAMQERNSEIDVIPDNELGKRAPTWIGDPETSMCMCCSVPFRTFRRRHHCRACGHVICGRCSSRKAPLAYIENREKRVCDPCYEKLRGAGSARKPSAENSDSVEDALRRKAPGLLQVKAVDPAIICGYLNLSGNKKNWSRRFVVVQENFVMYFFKAHQDVVATTSLPLPGYLVHPDETDEKVFKVFHQNQKEVYYFQADDEASKQRWVSALLHVVQLQLPPVICDEPRSPL